FTTEQAGDHTLVNLNVGEQSMVVKMSSDFEADFDKKVGITFSLEESYLFQKNNGERIEVRLVDK
ncbi:MAG: ABC transporter ATP-binding protein, partial [SAR324 cluster bacterium]|nr:ABC transporter ATP-binding protein [SAR324 cluster bacterium]